MATAKTIPRGCKVRFRCYRCGGETVEQLPAPPKPGWLARLFGAKPPPDYERVLVWCGRCGTYNALTPKG
jgi:hypothetical protein